MEKLENKFCDKCGKNINPIEIKLYEITKIFYPICECEAKINQIKQEQEIILNKQRRLESLFKQSRLGERFKNCTFENYLKIKETDGIYNKLLQYATLFNNYKKHSIILHSHPGTGKSYLASCVANKLLSEGISVIFIVVPDLLRQIRNTYNSENKENEEVIMSGLSECDLLILDDIGAEHHKNKEDWGTEKLYTIINDRYNSMKATIFTTNCVLQMLHDKLGDRTFSRICEMCDGWFFDMNNIKDFRMKRFYDK